MNKTEFDNLTPEQKAKEQKRLMEIQKQLHLHAKHEPKEERAKTPTKPRE